MTYKYGQFKRQVSEFSISDLHTISQCFVMRRDTFSNTNKVKMDFFQSEGYKTLIKEKSSLFGYIGLC